MALAVLMLLSPLARWALSRKSGRSSGRCGPRSESWPADAWKSSVALEELDRALVVLGRGSCGERAEIAALTRARILFPRHEPVLSDGSLRIIVSPPFLAVASLCGNLIQNPIEQAACR